MHHEKLLPFLSKLCLNFFTFCNKMSNFKQKRETNMRWKNSRFSVKSSVEITKWVVEYILGLITSSNSCSYFHITAKMIKSCM